MAATPQIDPLVLADCERLASQFGVSGQIHPDDFIFLYLHDHPTLPKTEAVAHYFEAGRTSAEKLNVLMRQHCTVARPTILEFAAGYGCVTRHLKSQFADATIIACDIHDQALAFISDQIHVTAIPSSNSPEGFSAGRTFDAVCAISSFSHMPKTSWRRWLKALVEHVSIGGILIFTTHGHVSLAAWPSISLDDDGFWFGTASEQKDLEPTEYGITFTSLDYVYRQIRELPGVRLLQFQEAFWFGHQDVYVLRREAAPVV